MMRFATGKPDPGNMMIKTVLVPGLSALVSNHQFCEYKGSCESRDHASNNG